MKTSVLVTCYRRKQYLRGAVESAKGADQIVVVKDWSDLAIDRWLDDNGATVLTKNMPRIGEAMARGITRCEGDIISFLDDDDMMLPNRLSVVRSEFEDHPRVVLFKNGYSEIDIDGRIIECPVAQPTTSVRFPCEGADLDWVTKNHAYGISSTISVKQEAIMPLIIDLAKVECGIDVALGILLMREGYEHSFNPRLLTLHRAGSTLRERAATGDSRAYARTFRRLKKTAELDVARKYARRNVRWATYEWLLGKERLQRWRNQ